MKGKNEMKEGRKDRREGKKKKEARREQKSMKEGRERKKEKKGKRKKKARTPPKSLTKVRGHSRAAGLLEVAGELVEEAVGGLTLHLPGQVHEISCLQQVGCLWEALADLQVGLPIEVGSLDVA